METRGGGGSGVRGQVVVKRSEDGFQGQGMKRISRRGGGGFLMIDRRRICKIIRNKSIVYYFNARSVLVGI